jgi:hypothetical protein
VSTSRAFSSVNRRLGALGGVAPESGPDGEDGLSRGHLDGLRQEACVPQAGATGLKPVTYPPTKGSFRTPIATKPERTTVKPPS